MKQAWRILVLAAILCGMLVTPAGAQDRARSYLLLSSGAELPQDVAASVAAAGGSVTSLIPQVGIAVASSSDANFKANAGKIKGISAVVPNAKLRWLQPAATIEAALAYPPTSGAGDLFFDAQWNMKAIQVVDAWNAGAKGAGARVAVLDDGIYAEHPDLAPNLNLALSASFVPGEDAFGGNHGTHVGGIIAAAMNDLGVIGVAPEAELVSVKVLSSADGSGEVAWAIAGIIYAADIDADVINMSLGGTLYRGGFVDEDEVYISASEVNELINAMNRATSYAHKQGSLLVASAMNDNIDFDWSANLVVIPAQSVNVVTVSATTPIGWALDFNTDLDVPTSYSNYGKSAIDLAAPGGDFLYAGDEVCTVGPFSIPCFVFDGVLSAYSCDVNGCNYVFWTGTSMAAPHVSGVAALVVGMHGGEMDPVNLTRILSKSADQSANSGKDLYLGHGRVNAYRAVMGD